MSEQAKQQPLTSIEHGCFDTAALQDELAQALEADRKYKLTDSMKKRAIHTAHNYDEFKNLVACADLKPISQRELRSFSKNERPANLSYKSKSRKTYGAKLQLPSEFADEPPKTAADFTRLWRRSLKTTEQKYRYLQLVTAVRLLELFKTDIDADLMADIVSVLVTSWKTLSDDNAAIASFALEFLEAFTKTSRFALTVDFLDNNQLETLRELFALLQQCECAGDDLAALKTQFRI